MYIVLRILFNPLEGACKLRHAWAHQFARFNMEQTFRHRLIYENCFYSFNYTNRPDKSLGSGNLPRFARYWTRNQSLQLALSGDHQVSILLVRLKHLRLCWVHTCLLVLCWVDTDGSETNDRAGLRRAPCVTYSRIRWVSGHLDPGATRSDLSACTGVLRVFFLYPCASSQSNSGYHSALLLSSLMEACPRKWSSFQRKVKRVTWPLIIPSSWRDWEDRDEINVGLDTCGPSHSCQSPPIHQR